MADNTTLNTGSGGDVIGSDDIAGVKYQRVKLIHGADGTNDGDVASANPLPVDASGTTVTVDNGGTFATQATLQANDGVDIGDVDVTSVVPGTGATALGKAIDGAVGATDTGVALLAKHQEDQVHLTTADGDYDVLTLDSLGSLHVNAESHHVFDTFNATTGWTALGDDTINLATTAKHISGTAALTFDKADGTANTVFAGIQKTLSSTDLGAVSPHDLLQGAFYIPDITNVAYAFLRLGTDSSNYNEWRLPDTALTAATFEVGSLAIGAANYAGITGNGWNPSAITYICVGVAFDSETDTLAGIVFDEVSYHTNQHTSAILNAEVTSDVSSPNVRLNGYGGNTDTNTGNASASTMRVVLASDQPVVSVDDNAGSLTVDAANDGSLNVTVGDGSNTATIRNLAANDALNVAIVDAAGDQVTSFGGGTQYAEDTAHSTGDQLTMAGVVQQAADTALSGDGDRSLMQVDANGYLKVNVKAGAAGGVTHTDDAAFTPGTDDVVPAAAMFDDVTPDSVDEGDAGVLRMSANRNLYSTIRDAAGNERGVNVTAGNALTVDGSATTQPVSAASLPLPTGAATAAGQLADGHNVTAAGDVAHDAADSGNPIKIGGKAYTTLPTAAGTGDRVDQTMTTQGGALVAGTDGTTPRNVAVNASGQLEVDISAQQGAALTVDGSATTQPISAASLPLPSGAATAANQLPDGHNVTVDNAAGASAVNIQDGGNSITVDWNGTAPPIGAGLEATALRVTLPTDGTGIVGAVNGDAGLVVLGAQAHDAAVSGNPLLLAGEARTSVPTAVGNGDVVRLQADDQGRLVVVQNSPRDLVTQGNITLSSGTETTVIAAGGAGVFQDVTMITASNTSSTAVRIDIRDASAGTVRLSMMLAADGGGFTLPFPTPMTQTTANNAWTAQISSAATDVRVFMQTVDRA